MFLKALTLKGFKSFADKTHLDFETGVTVVVGPNGSGKSNLVDAVAWVLGAQGPRTLRGGKMDDVIFAGTPDRPALGRAEVSLTIDNTAGLLAIDFSEVTITRTLFRSGDSEYAINGAPCRLLDIQEILSDTGIGRQQHVIVGQGQLDTILNSRPEDRRAVVEEAAGVLKYRKRRERAERRLEATEGNLLRLQDLLREVRRQLTPLQRQADAARRHGGLVEELRAIRLNLAGHELAGLQTRLERLQGTRAEHDTRETEVRGRLRELDLAVLESEQSLTAVGDDDLAEWMVRVESLRERARGLRALVAEKQRGIERELAAAADQGVVETLVADASALRAELMAVEAEAATVEPLRRDVADAEFIAADTRVDPEAVRGAEETWRNAERAASTWRARADALAQSLEAARNDAGAGLLRDVEAVTGPLIDHVEIEAGCEAAVATALGDAMRAIVVQGGHGARRALERLKGGDAHAFLLVVDSTTADAQGEFVPAGSRALAECVHARLPGLEPSLARLLAHTVLVDAGWQSALDIALTNPGLVVVTREGDRFGGGLWQAGPERTGGVTQAALDEAFAQAGAAETARRAAEQTERVARAALAQSQEAQQHAAALRRDLEVRTAGVDERRAVLTRRLAVVEARLARDPKAQAAAERHRAALTTKSSAYARVERGITERLAAIDALHERLRERRRVQSEAVHASAERLDGLRKERAQFEQQLAELRELQSRREVEDAETRMRLENAVEKLRADFDCEPAVALDAPAPEAPAGTTLAGRARELDRELRIMGPINPLALEEYDALQERHQFLQDQLEDVKNSRRELTRVIKAVDHEIVTVFETAFNDVQENFSSLFSTLFPGGSGRIFLTDPDDLLNTGIEIEARPSGKNTRRLSLLSGGERALTALAFLFSVFRARPSPFYLLDEVEAALDDVNLHRFLDLIHEFRNEAQLVVVSHQKRTMEAADCLYGVSMPPGGSSRVVSQRMNETLEQDTLVLP